MNSAEGFEQNEREWDVQTQSFQSGNTESLAPIVKNENILAGVV